MSFTKLVQPNATVSKHWHWGAAAAWTLTALLVWAVFRPSILPGPGAVLSAFPTLWNRGVFTGDLLHSFTVNLQAILWSTLLSLFFAYTTVMPLMRSPVSAMTKLRFLGLTGLTLPFTLLFPGGDGLRIAILTFGMTANFVTSMSDVVANIPREEFDHARSLGFSDWRSVWEVVILGKADAAFEVLRQNAAIGWMMLTMVEVIAQSGGGIGLVLYKANRQFDLLPQVFAILVVILMVGYLQDLALRWLKRTVCPYAELKLERR